MKKIGIISLTVLLLVGCSPTKQQEEKHIFTVYGMSGPTSMGLAGYLVNQNEDFTQIDLKIVVDASEVTTAIANKSADIAMLPANAAATLYNKMQGFSVVAINTLGVLYIVNDTSKVTILNINDLKDKTIVLTGEGTTPEYSLRYILENNGLTDSVSLEFKASAQEVAASMAEGLYDITLLPQPFVTTVLNKNANLKISLSLTDLWNEITTESQLVTGVAVVRDEILEKYPNQIENFINNYKQSVDWVNANPQQAANKIVELGIIANESIAKQSIPYCNLVCYTGKQMKDTLQGYLTTLLKFNPKSIGGSLPQEGFYN